jgi:hypothetical protein
MGNSSACLPAALAGTRCEELTALAEKGIGESRSHAGVILVPSSVGNEAFGALISGAEETLAETNREDWIDRVAWLRKA